MSNADIDADPLVAPRRRGVGEILSQAFTVYKTRAALLIATAAVAMGPVYLVRDAILAAAFAPATTTFERDSARMEELQKRLEEAQARGASPAEIEVITRQELDVALSAGAHGVGMLAGLFLGLLGMLVTIPFLVLATFLAQAALTVVVADGGRTITRWQDPWRGVITNLAPLLGTALLVFIGVAIGLFFFVLPGLLFGFLAAFCVPIVLLENKSGIAAIRRSMALVSRDWLRVVIVIVLFGILKLVASWLGGLLIPTRLFFLHTLVGDLVSIAVLPIPIIGIVLLYQDLVRPATNRVKAPSATTNNDISAHPA